jgi:dienelactone hydrolase
MNGKLNSRKYLLAAAFLAGSVFLSPGPAAANIVTRDVDYKDGNTELQGYLAYDDSITEKMPGIVIAHAWKGLGPYEKMRAEQLAKLGYAAFCADIYGRGIRPADNKAAAKQAGLYRADRKLLRRRAEAALAELKKQDMVDAERLAAIGYCFGGGTVLELARDGADIAGAVSFHGNLDTPNPDDAKNIKAKILICHGADDPYTSSEQLLGFMKEMRDAKVDWQMDVFGNAVHGFTMPDSGGNTSAGMAYNEKADKRSWEAMKIFFNEIFKK